MLFPIYDEHKTDKKSWQRTGKLTLFFRYIFMTRSTSKFLLFSQLYSEDMSYATDKVDLQQVLREKKTVAGFTG